MRTIRKQSLRKYQFCINTNCFTHFSSGGGGISCIGVEIGVFSVSIIANGASGSGKGDTELSMGAVSPVAGSVAFPALLPNLTPFHKLFRSMLCYLSFFFF